MRPEHSEKRCLCEGAANVLAQSLLAQRSRGPRGLPLSSGSPRPQMSNVIMFCR